MGLPDDQSAKYAASEPLLRVMPITRAVAELRRRIYAEPRYRLMVNPKQVHPFPPPLISHGLSEHDVMVLGDPEIPRGKARIAELPEATLRRRAFDMALTLSRIGRLVGVDLRSEVVGEVWSEDNLDRLVTAVERKV